MRYLSTRGDVSSVSAATAIRLGIAPDGGLFLPEIFPKLSADWHNEMADVSYVEMAAAVLGLYLTDYQGAELLTMAKSAYQSPEKFDTPLIAPVTRCGDGLHLLELWHGPTCAFKDMALQILPYLMTEANKITGDRTEIVILVATSGDTGKAALEGFRDVPGTKILVYFPEQGVSAIQRLQMVTQTGANTYVAAVRGNFDDAQNGVKRIFADQKLVSRLAAKGMVFSSANSINWGRLVPQIVYYFHGYFELCRQGVLKQGDQMNIAVPTGNFGNILAAFIAWEMGLPVRKLLCASNSNNVLTDFIREGVYDRNRSFHTTISPSMDILISSNLERLLFYLADRDPAQIKKWMTELKETGRYVVTQKVKERLQDKFYGDFANEEETQTTIRDTFRETGVVLDPHTAVGMMVTKRYRKKTGDFTPGLIASTASPFKFNLSVLSAIGGAGAVAGKDEFQLLDELQGLTGSVIPAGLRGLNRMEVRHRAVCEKDGMAVMVEKLL